MRKSLRPVPRNPIVYIAGALNASANQYLKNLHRMIIWAEKIRKLGYAVFVPGNDIVSGITCGDLAYEDVFQNSQPFLEIADYIFVVPGWEESKGTARELVTAKEFEVPVYYEQKGYEKLKEIAENRKSNVNLNEENK